MKYLKKFSTHSDYATFTGGTDFILPNISYCVNEDEVHFNQIVADTHEYVDLGLPSGTLWATENIKDANGNELYFAWGETKGYTSGQVGTDKNFSLEDYEFGDNPSKYNKSDGKTVLEATDDAATENWGSNWKMPTKEQFEELTAYTITAWTQVDGVNGMLCCTKNENTLFLPAVGEAYDGKFSGVGNACYYWSGSLFYDVMLGAWALDVIGDNCVVEDTNRYYGFSVRPVRVETNSK